MTITRERFEQGLTYEAYKAQMTRNLDRLEANEQLANLDPADIAYFRNLTAPIHLLIIGEDWCGDVINNVPVIARMAQETSKLNIRLFLRDQNLDIMDQYLKEGKYRSIPVVVAFDEDFRELGYWIERPAEISELSGKATAELFATDPLFEGIAPGTSPGELPEAARNRMMQFFRQFREEHRANADRMVIRDLRAIIEGRGLRRDAENGQVAATPKAATAAAAPTTSNIADLKRRAEAAKNRSGKQVKVSITYCAVCGYEPQTLGLTSALMTEFIYDLSAIELIPWQDGAFDVVVDGELVHSMYRDGGFPENAAIINAVREKLAS
jgi:selT/selW/selH-like putative selenoprotein